MAIRLGIDVWFMAGAREVAVLQSCLWKSDRRESGRESGWMFSGRGGQERRNCEAE